MTTSQAILLVIVSLIFIIPTLYLIKYPNDTSLIALISYFISMIASVILTSLSLFGLVYLYQYLGK